MHKIKTCPPHQRMLAMLMTSAIPRSRNCRTCTIALYHHWVLLVTGGSYKDNIVAALKVVERTALVNGNQPTLVFPSSSLATKRQRLCSCSNTKRFFSNSASNLPLSSKTHRESPQRNLGNKQMLFHIRLFNHATRFTGQNDKFTDYIGTTQVNTWVWFGKTGLHGHTEWPCSAEYPY